MEGKRQDTKHARGRILLTNEEQPPTVPKSDYDALVTQLAEFKDTADKILEENQQLKDVLKKMDLGITKASDIIEGIARTEDQTMINEIGCRLAGHHPKSVIIKYRGQTLTEITSE